MTQYSPTWMPWPRVPPVVLSNEGDRALIAAHPEFLVFSDVRRAADSCAVDGDRVLGFATTLVAGVDELTDLFVDPDWMRRGIASI